MLDFTWKLFCMTGSVDTYLLLKEIEVDGNELEEARNEEPAHLNLEADLNQPFA